MFQVFYRLIIIMVSLMLHGKAICRIHEELNKMRYVTKKWLFDSIEWLFNGKRGTRIDKIL